MNPGPTTKPAGRRCAPEKPRFGVRISRGIVTYWGDQPLLTWEQANEARKAIREHMGEEGEVEEVFVL